MIAMHESAQDLLAPETFGYCERILCLYAPDQAPSWWLALADPERAFFALGSVQTASPVGQAAVQGGGSAQQAISLLSSDSPAEKETMRGMTQYDEPRLAAQSAPSSAKHAESSPGTSSTPTAALSLRLREIPLDQVRWAVEQAVADGYRPHVFVPGPGDWPAVYDALGRYQDFARLWICGRDDRTMTELLHQPAAEVLDVQRSGGYLVVPDLEYGKALDQVLLVTLADFQEDTELTPSPDGPQTRYARVSRLNPFRRVTITVNKESSDVHLAQVYFRGDISLTQDICQIPIGLQDIRLQFHGGECHLGHGQEDLAAAVIGWLGLPVADSTPWIRFIAKRLARMPQETGTHLSRALQLALAGFARSREALDALWQQMEVLPKPTQTFGRRRIGGQVCGVPGATHPPTILAVIVTQLQSTDLGLNVGLEWRRNNKPTRDPAIRVYIQRGAGDEEIAMSRATLHWWPDRSGLTLQLPGNPLQRPAVSWQWDHASGLLELRFRESESIL